MQMYSFDENECQSLNRERKIFMKKYLSAILALTLCLCLLVTGCSKNNVESESTDTASATNDQNTETQKPHSEIEPSKNQVRTGNYVCEYGDYIFYRNTNNNGSIYRYNIKDNTYIRLYDENYNAFLHSLCVYDDFLYFVTKTESDNAPTLYRIAINGGEAECLIENVWDDFCVTKDAIYYTVESQLHKYTFSTKESTAFQISCESFNLIGDKIYCLTLDSDNGGYKFAYFDISTQSTVNIPTGEIRNFQYAVSANNGKIIYLNFNEFIYSYNTETQEFKEIANSYGITVHLAVANDDLLYFYTREDNKYKIYQYKDNAVTEYTDRQFESFHVLEVIDNKPIMISANSMGPNKILGDERLNVIVEEAKVGNVPPGKNNVIANYYDMTINDVIEIWGTNYELDGYYITDGFAGIKYSHKLCPFAFYFNATQMPDAISGEEKITFIAAAPIEISPNFYITDYINLDISFSQLSDVANGRFDFKHIFNSAQKRYEGQFNLSPQIKVNIIWLDSDSATLAPENQTRNVTHVYFSY